MKLGFFGNSRFPSDHAVTKPELDGRSVLRSSRDNAITAAPASTRAGGKGDIMHIARRLRGTVGMAATWAVAWGAIGLVPSIAVQAFWSVRNDEAPLSLVSVTAMAVNGIVFWAAWGAITGTVFSALLITFQRNSTVDSVSADRIATWGRLSGLTIPVLALAYATTHGPGLRTVPGVFFLLVLGVLIGRWCGRSTFLLARRTPRSKSW
jgi:hypothetical protein